jgi:ABC-type Fe3+ transport system substrate-binding protein
MLDLKNLEAKLDEALAKETAETLTKWLLKKRAQSYLAHLGQGEFNNLETVKVELQFPLSDTFIESETLEVHLPIDAYYTMAA